MKKKKIANKLNLNKKAISHLNEEINGGFWSTGCSDGCSPAQTALNCTNAGCSNDCGNGVSRCSACDPFQDY